eukprot:COSAG06_NODE_39243_length_414_cov_11.742857_1_plen_49_part_10
MLFPAAPDFVFASPILMSPAKNEDGGNFRIGASLGKKGRSRLTITMWIP